MNKKLAALAAVATIGIGAGTAHADPGPIAVIGTPRIDFLIGTQRSEVFFARAGNDRVFGRAATDWLRGGNGNDVLRDWRSRRGTDRLIGGDGFDICVGNATDIFRNCEVIRIRAAVR